MSQCNLCWLQARRYMARGRGNRIVLEPPRLGVGRRIYEENGATKTFIAWLQHLPRKCECAQ